MPIYEYQCSVCEHEFETIQKFSDPPVTDCPKCDREGSVAKKLSVSAFILGGGGWYNDGYSGKKNGKGGKEKVDSGSDSKAEPSGDSANKTSSTSEAGCGQGACAHCAA